MTKETAISKESTVLDIVAAYPRTERYFRSLDAQAGECVLCNSLFESLEGLAKKCSLDPDHVLDQVSALID